MKKMEFLFFKTLLGRLRFGRTSVLLLSWFNVNTPTSLMLNDNQYLCY